MNRSTCRSQFLALYAIFSVSVLAFLYVGKRRRMRASWGRCPCPTYRTSSYLLRGCARTLRLGVAVLIDRGLLDMDDLHVLQR